MSRTTVHRVIAAPVEVVFNTVADIRQFSQAVPRIMKYEFLSQLKSGLGTRFRETSHMQSGQEVTTELEITEYVPNERVRMVADTHGTIWNSVFTVKSAGAQTELVLVMDAHPHTLLTRVMNPLIKSMVQKALAQDMNLVKAFCENGERKDKGAEPTA
jgi:uncharacterized membrane protein